MIARNVLLLAVLSGVCACSSGSEPVDIGDGRTGQKLEDYAAHWEGYAEAYDFSDGSDKVKVTLDELGNGTLEIGDTPLFAPATNPDVAYPPTYKRQQFESLYPGISYPIRAATVESARIRLSVNPWEVERDWCAFQTSYAMPSGYSYPDPDGIATGYRCGPFRAVAAGANGEACVYTGDGTPEMPVDCDKANLCQDDACSCDATGCSVREAPSGKQDAYTKFDAALDDSGDSLVGTLKVGVGGDKVSMTVRLHGVSSN